MQEVRANIPKSIVKAKQGIIAVPTVNTSGEIRNELLSAGYYCKVNGDSLVE